MYNVFFYDILWIMLHGGFQKTALILALQLLLMSSACDESEKDQAYSVSNMQHLPPPSTDMLISLVEDGSYGPVLNVISRGADPKAHGKDGRTALHAFFSGKNWRQDKNLLDLLFRKGADPNSVDSHGRTPLHFAAEQNKFKLADKLIFRGSKVNADDEQNRTPLHLAAQSDSEEIAKILLENGAALDRKDERGKSPLALAAQNKHWRTSLLLLESGADPMTEDEFGQVPIKWLAKKCYEEIDDKGPNANCLKVRSLRNSTLHIAAAKGNERVAEFLLENVANPSVLFKFDNNMSASCTALCAAVTNNHTDLLTLLLDHGADPNIPDANGWTPLHLAIWKNHPDMARALVSHGADTSARTRSGQSVMALAKKMKSYSLLKKILLKKQQ